MLPSALFRFCPFQSLMQEARLHAGVSLGSRDACTGIFSLWRGLGFDSVPEWSYAVLCPQGIGTWGYSHFRPDKAFSVTSVQVPSSVSAVRKVLSWAVLSRAAGLKQFPSVLHFGWVSSFSVISVWTRNAQPPLAFCVTGLSGLHFLSKSVSELSCFGTAFELGKGRGQFFTYRIHPCLPR